MTGSRHKVSARPSDLVVSRHNEFERANANPSDEAIPNIEKDPNHFLKQLNHVTANVTDVWITDGTFSHYVAHLVNLETIYQLGYNFYYIYPT